MKKSFQAQSYTLLAVLYHKAANTSNNLFSPAVMRQLLLLGFLLFAFAFSAQAQYSPIVTSGSNGCSITGTFNYNSIQNGKPKYLLGINTIGWTGTKWTVSNPNFPSSGGVFFENTQNTFLPPCSSWVSVGCGGTFSISSGCQPPCTFTPSNITVSGFGCLGPNGVYTPNGTLNGAPKWDSQYGPGNFRIVWTGIRWEIQDNTGSPSYPWAANSTGSITNLPCSGNWTDPLGVGCISTGVVLSGGCGSLLPVTVSPSVSISANTGNIIIAGTSVTFTATPTNGGTPIYQWKKNNSNVGTNSNTYTDAGLVNGDVITCVMTSSNPCASPATATSTAVTMTVNPALSPSCYKIQVTTSCSAFDGEYLYAGDYLGGGYWDKSDNSSYEIFFDGNGWVIWDYGFYLFANSSTSLPLPPTIGWSPWPGNACDGMPITNFQLIPVTATPTVSISANPGNSINAGTSVTFTATPTNGGSTPAYQWKKNNSNVGTNSNTYADSGLVNGDVITCVMTSSDPCASPTSATSSTITMMVTVPPGPSCTTYINKTTANGLGSNTVNDVFADGGKVYAATAGGLGISTDGGNTFTNIVIPNPPVNNPAVNRVYAEGVNIYAAMEFGLGVSNNSGASFTLFSSFNTPGLGGFVMRDVYVSNAVIYVAMQNGLDYSVNGGANFIHRTTANGLGNNSVHGVFVVGNNVYAATEGGLSISTDGGVTFTNKTTADGLADNFVRDVYVVGNTVYAATISGLSISTNGGNTFTTNTAAGIGGSNYMYSVYAIGSTIYVGKTYGMVISTDGGTTFSHYLTTNGLGGNTVKGVYAAGDKVFAATNGGLSFCGDCVTTATPFPEKFYEHVSGITTYDDINGCGIAYGDGKFVAVLSHYSTGGYIFTSTDGVNWTEQTAPTPNNYGFYNIHYANGQFLMTGANQFVFTSPDGITWTSHNVGLPARYESIAYGNGAWLIVGSNGALRKSTDNGDTWSGISSPAGVNWISTTYGNGVFVIGGLGNAMFASSDLVNWTPWDQYVFAYKGFTVTFGDDKFVAVRSDGNIYTSSNGINWTAQNSGTTDGLYEAAYVNGQFLVSDGWSETNGDLLNSENGICWASQPTGFPYGFYRSIAFANGIYAAIGGSGNIYSTLCHTPVAFILSSTLNCSEGTGATIELSGSEINYNYQLVNDGSFIGSPMSGNAGTLFFTGLTEPGSYTVTTTSLTGSCSASMTGSINVLPGELPVVSPVSVESCPGQPVNLSASSSIGSINWYDAQIGGNLLGNSASGDNFSVSPVATTTYYAQINAPPSGSQTFQFTGAPQMFTVPEGVTSITVTAKGAGGSDGYYEDGPPGEGGTVTTDLTVTPGQVLNIYVGGLPTGDYEEIGGYNGGGSSLGEYYGAGGGATDIRIGGMALTDRVIVAGGGGGAGYDGTGGGNGGGLIGEAGDDDTSYPEDAKGGGGGTQSAGGAGGLGIGGNGYPGQLGIGGDGADYYYYGAGGGGGYYGGGGEDDSGYVGGGGGGSSYTNPELCNNVVHQQGGNPGNGIVFLQWGEGCPGSERVAVTVVVNDCTTPSVSINGTTTGCGSVSLTATGGDSYAWSGGETPNSASNTFTTSGTYTVTVTVAGGSSATASQAVTVTTPTSTTTTISACDSYTWSVNGTTYTASGNYTSVSGCHTEILALTITNSTSNTTTISACDSYTWSVNGTTYTASGNYTSASGCHTETLNLTITQSGTACNDGNPNTINDMYNSSCNCVGTPCNLGATINGNTNICAGAALSIIATGGNQYQWSGPGGFTTSSGGSIVRYNATPAMSGTYSVTITNNDCTSVLSLQVTVHPIPSATITGITPVCSGGTINLSAPAGAASYAWSGPGGYTASTASITRSNATTLMSGSYSVTVTNAGGCTASASKLVSVSAVSTASISGATSACGDATLSLTATTAGVSYLWSGPGGFSANTATMTRTPAVAGIYTVTVTDAGGCIATGSKSVTVSAATTASISAPLGLNPAVGGMIYLIASGGSSYSWSGPGGFSFSSTTITRRSATTAMCGTYTVTVTGAGGCTASASVYVNVGGSCGGGKTGNDTEILTAYPNPFTETTTLEFSMPQTTEAVLNVYGIDGREVAQLFKGTVEAGQLYTVQFEGAGLASGVYIVSLTGEMGEPLRYRIMLSK